MREMTLFLNSHISYIFNRKGNCQHDLYIFFLQRKTKTKNDYIFVIRHSGLPESSWLSTSLVVTEITRTKNHKSIPREVTSICLLLDLEVYVSGEEDSFLCYIYIYPTIQQNLINISIGFIKNSKKKNENASMTPTEQFKESTFIVT